LLTRLLFPHQRHLESKDEGGEWTPQPAPTISNIKRMDVECGWIDVGGPGAALLFSLFWAKS